VVALAVAGITCGLLLAAPAQAQFNQQGPKLVAADAVGTAFQGVSVSVSGDGNTAIVGGAWDNGFVGAAFVYTRSGGVWTQQAKLVGSDIIGEQGLSVALSGDGNTAIAGGPGDNFSGAAWVYRRSTPGPHITLNGPLLYS
jgi:hypothetical protein